MRARQIRQVVVLGLAITAQLTAQDSGRLPSVARPDPLEWTPVSELVDPGDFPGRPDLSEEILEAMRARGLAVFGEPCILIRNILDGNSPNPRPGTLDEVVAVAAVVVVGEVVSAAPGFVGEVPGIMLEIRAQELTGAVTWTDGDPLFVFFEGGRIPVGDDVLCVVLDEFPLAPRVGDYLLLFPYASNLKRQSHRRRSFLTIDGGPSEMSMYWSAGTGEFHRSSILLHAVPELSADQDLGSFLGSVRAAVERAKR